MQVTHTTGDPYDHLAIKADEPLPITETGYRSHFIPPQDLALFDSPNQFVLEWLTEAANTKDWQQQVADARQGELF